MNFEKLEVWQRSTRLSVEIYKYFAFCRDFGFKDQITRASLSVPSNIAEGIERLSDKETIRFLDIAKGSAGELSTQILIGIEIKLIETNTGEKWRKETKEIAAMLGGFMKWLANNKIHPKN